MSHGPGNLQRQILDFMGQMASHQRSPRREHWRVEPLILNIFRDDRPPPLTGRQRADARKQIRRACDRLASSGRLVKVGVGWQLPAETDAEARARRKRNRSMGSPKEQERKERAEQRRSEWVFGRQQQQKIDPIDPASRKKLAGILGQLGSDSDNVKLVAFQKAEALRKQLSVTWDEILGVHK